MTLNLYDTLTRKKRAFAPIDKNNVRIYVCGPTVYDYAHIGNARPVIVFDVLFRLLRHIYGAEHVTYVRNITDVEDKINERAARDFPNLPLNEAIARVTKTTGEQFQKDIAALGVLPPTVEPRATAHIGEMRELIERLVQRGFAYVAQDHVLFSPKRITLPRYGALSNRSLDEMLADSSYKRDPMDFVLWKPSKPGEPAWPSPAGIAVPGRPGWHIECSAMADKWLWTEAKSSLGESGLAHPHQFDIHGGGIDLVFPHHENEIAQTCSAFGHKVMANYWMHNGFLQVERQKMSKSLGNFVTINDLLKSWPGEVIRLAMLKTHYRQPIDWTAARLKESELLLRKWILSVPAECVGSEVAPAVMAALSDDLNTHMALAEIHSLAKAARNGHRNKARALMASLNFLGLLPRNHPLSYTG